MCTDGVKICICSGTFQSPHTPAPAPVFDIDKEVEIIKQEKEHDTSIARQAREKFYKKATEAIEHQRDHKEFLLSKDTKDIILDIIDGVNAEPPSAGATAMTDAQIGNTMLAILIALNVAWHYKVI